MYAKCLSENEHNQKGDITKKTILNLHPGEIVEVRSQEEILATLDENRELGKLSFTSEMLKFCGRRFRVLNYLERIMVEGIGIRKIDNAVILEGVTCDGEFHEGCGRTCQLIWREEWLKKVDSQENASMQAATQSIDYSGEKDKAIVPCQSVNLVKATSLLSWNIFPNSNKDTKQSFGLVKRLYSFLVSISIRLHTIGKKKYDVSGRLKKTPTQSLHLRVGELVQVKSKEEILETLDSQGRNRGLGFSPEMMKFCGEKHRVGKRVEKAINEANGNLRQIANTVILEEVTCNGGAHGDCLRNCFCLWREIWLKRVD